VKRVLILAAVMLALGASPSQAFKAKLRADATVERWVTPQRWTPNEGVAIRAFRGGKEVPADYDDCTATFRGSGLYIRVTGACVGGKTPLRVTYVSLGGPKSFTLVYKTLR
jgi:hypothetical protein